MFGSRKNQLCSLFIATTTLTACGGSGSSTPDWKTEPLAENQFLKQIISNDNATVTVAYFGETMTWIDDDGEVLATKEVVIDPDLIGNESIVESSVQLMKRSGQWTLWSLVELADGRHMIVLMPVDFASGSLPESSGFLPGSSIELDTPLTDYGRKFELSNGHWMFAQYRSNTSIIDVVEFSEQGALIAQHEVDYSGHALEGVSRFWLTSSDELRLGDKSGIYAVKGNQLVALWSTATDCGIAESFFNKRARVPIVNESGEAILGCGNDKLIRVQPDGSVLQYPVELPANAVNLLEVNYFAQPGGDMWFALTYSPIACNENGSCSGALLDMRGLVKRYSLNGELEINYPQGVDMLGAIGTIPNGFILNDGAAMFLTAKGQGAYTLVNNAGAAKWSAVVPGPFLGKDRAEAAYLAPNGDLFLASSPEHEIYRFDTSKR